MAIDMLYFAWVRDAIGRDAERLSPPEDVTSIATLLDWLETLDDGYARAFADRERLRAAMDQRFVPLDAPVSGAREIAIFPPVTGG